MFASRREPGRALALGTTALAVSFVSWGLIGPLAPQIQSQFRLTNSQVSMLIAAPVLLGSLGRIPLGLLTDRWGGRRVFSLLLAGQAVPLALAGLAPGFGSFLAAAVLLGLGGAAFAVGVPFVSRWYPPDRQGLALGVYGLGNIGTGVAAVLAPWLAGAVGMRLAFWALIPMVLAAAAVFYRWGHDAPGRPTAPGGLAWVLGQPGAWLLCLFYFVTFGGFVAFGGYLPKLYADLFGLSRTAAGTGAAAFVLLATACRPLGGWLADRVGGRAALAGALAAVTGAAVWLSLAPALAGFRAAALVLGTGLGLGNGAVFKLVPELFPGRTGAVTGLVGAVGGLGGFFPPLLMGALGDRLGTYTPGFTLLAVTAAGVWLLLPALAPPPAPWRLPPTDRAAAELERRFLARAVPGGALAVAALLLAIYLGSGRLMHFDPALYGYAVATVIAALGVVLRVTAWLMRPAARTLLVRLVQLAGRRVAQRVGRVSPVAAGVGRRPAGEPHPGGWVAAGDRHAHPRLSATPGGDPGLEPERHAEAAGAGSGPGPRRRAGRPGLRAAAATLIHNWALNRFIFRRTWWRGTQHFFLMWGVLGSFAITVPLVFGWLHFEAVDESHYRVVAMGAPVLTMPVRGWLSGMFFHALSAFGVLTLIGAGMALWRRLRDKDARVDQRVEYDLFPLYLLLAVTVTGLALSVSHLWLAGAAYPFISVVHQVTVVALLLYLPFGKFWHVPLRLGSVAAEVYHEVGAHLGEQPCARCGKVYATRMQIRDVTGVMAETGLHLLAPDGRTYLHEYCPECRRVLRALLYTRRPPLPEERGAADPLPLPEQRGAANPLPPPAAGPPRRPVHLAEGEGGRP